MAVSNNIVAVLNFIAFLCSIPIIVSGVWLASKQDNECIHLLRWPVILVGVLILLVSLTGFVGAFWNKQGPLVLYLIAMAVLIVLLLIVLIFAFIVTRPDGSKPVYGRGYKEYYLGGFSGWLRNYVTDPGRWTKIQRCLSESDVCTKMGRAYMTPEQFYEARLSPLESGCCKPPTVCGYTYVNPTLWTSPTNPAADPDCTMWSNDPSQFCYACSSCKAGLLGNLRKEWRRANVILIVTLVVLIWVYLIACSAFKNAQTEDLFRRYKRGYV